MSASSPKIEATRDNPYSAPKSFPSAFAKSYLTLAACLGTGAIFLAVATLLYTQTLNSAYEEDLNKKYEPPIVRRGQYSSGPAIQATQTPTVVDAQEWICGGTE